MEQEAGVYSNKRCYSERKNTFIPNEHQELVRNYFLESRHKGLLLYHKLGSGKTCTSILIADSMLQQNRISKVYVITPGSLRENWISEYCRICGKPSFTLDNFFFITYNYDVKDQIMNINFNNSLVIIDEVHNLVNGIKNFSKNAYAIYYKITNSNCRTLVLSGTPIFNNTIEFAILGSMLSNKFDWVLKKGDFENVEKGESEWDTTTWAILKQNPQKIKQLISGIVSYYAGDLTAYPEVRYIEPLRCPMSEQQFNAYKKAFETEQKRRRNPPKIKLKFENPKQYKEDFAKYVIAVQWTSTRASSNCLMTKPYNFIPDLYDNSYIIYTMEKFRDIVSKIPGVVDADTIIENLKQRKGLFIGNEPVPFQYLFYDDNKKIKVYGWLTDNILREERTNLLNMSKKYSILLTNIILNPNQKHIVFSFYKTTRGTLMLYSLLSHCGIKAKLYSGDIPAVRRQRIIDMFNHPSNENGEKIQVMLLTEAGAEGISLIGVNNVHIVESSIRENKNIQAIGRAVRYKSHFNMPEDRQFVNVFRYWSTHEGEEIDEMLYKEHFNKKTGKKSILDEFLILMENYSIEAIGSGVPGGEMVEEQKIEEIEEINIEVPININGKEYTISIPSTFSIQNTTNYIIDKYLFPPQRIRNTILTNVLIDLNIVSENSPPFDPESTSVNIDSQNKIVEYIEGNLILYTYNVKDVESIKFKFIGKGSFGIKDLPINIKTTQLEVRLKTELEIFYRDRYPDIIIEDIRLFDKNKRMKFTDETNLLIYYLSRKPIEFEITTSNPSI